MEGVIDISLVKEQLRLLGHTVSDDVIKAFVQGLNKGDAAGAAAAGGLMVKRVCLSFSGFCM